MSGSLARKRLVATGADLLLDKLLQKACYSLQPRREDMSSLQRLKWSMLGKDYSASKIDFNGNLLS